MDSYHEGLNLGTILKLEMGTLPPVDHMVIDCDRGYKVVVGFCERHQENNAQTLRQFLEDHPEFSFLIQPILDYDPETGVGEIEFRREGDRIKALIQLLPIYENDEGEEIPVELSPELFGRLLQLIEPFACFMAQNGELPLNF